MYIDKAIFGDGQEFSFKKMTDWIIVWIQDYAPNVLRYLIINLCQIKNIKCKIIKNVHLCQVALNPRQRKLPLREKIFSN